MKTALCLSGHMRTYKDTSEGLIKNIIEPLNCDVYIHTWDIRDHTPHGYYEDKKDDDFSKIKELLNPKKMVVENQEKVTKNIIRPTIQKHALRGAFHNKPEGVLCMYYKKQKVFELVEEQGVDYDMIITTRPDILCGKSNVSDSSPLSYEDFDLNVINLPPADGMAINCEKHIPSGKLIGGYGSFGGCADIFAAGNKENIKNYSAVYNNIVSYTQLGCPLQAERLLMQHLFKNELKVREVNALFGILRDIDHNEWLKNENR